MTNVGFDAHSGTDLRSIESHYRPDDVWNSALPQPPDYKDTLQQLRFNFEDDFNDQIAAPPSSWPSEFELWDIPTILQTHEHHMKPVIFFLMFLGCQNHQRAFLLISMRLRCKKTGAVAVSKIQPGKIVPCDLILQQIHESLTPSFLKAAILRNLYCHSTFSKSLSRPIWLGTRWEIMSVTFHWPTSLTWSTVCSSPLR